MDYVVGSETYRFRQKAPQNGHDGVQGHSRSSIWYRLKACKRLPISKSYKLGSYLASFWRYRELLIKLAGQMDAAHTP